MWTLKGRNFSRKFEKCEIKDDIKRGPPLFLSPRPFKVFERSEYILPRAPLFMFINSFVTPFEKVNWHSDKKHSDTIYLKKARS